VQPGFGNVSIFFLPILYKYIYLFLPMFFLFTIFQPNINLSQRDIKILTPRPPQTLFSPPSLGDI
jgi:hypothetical protein